jgi:(1->4)-alpha-D-glucan 1-alpha-D-glucosylmutase
VTPDDLLPRVLARLAERTARPRCTYRVQFHKDSTFRMAAGVAPYLAALGVSHLYASPYLKARPGSTHGYDIADHGSFNPEIGDQADYDAMVDALRAHGMGQILDIVPNHMGIAGGLNTWWVDVLENGRASAFARFFDIDWDPIEPDLRNKVLLPVLGDQYGRVLESGELGLAFDGAAFWVTYYDNRFPVNPRSMPLILSHRVDQLAEALGAPEPVGAGGVVAPTAPAAVHPALVEYQSIMTAVKNLPTRHETDPMRVAERHREKEVIKRRLAALCESEPKVRRFIDDNVAIFNGRKGDPRSFDLLDQLLDEQVYRLAYWRVAAEEINYRRFFDVNDLAAIRMDDPAVFEATHRLILELLRTGKVDGLRVDHPDGLFDPLGYFRRLQRAHLRQVCEDVAGADPAARALLDDLVARLEARAAEDPAGPAARPLFLVIEKILMPDEALPPTWPVSGTVGYEYLNLLGGLFVDPSEARRLDDLYAKVIGERIDFRDLVYTCKKLVMYTALASETNVLGRQLDRISERHRWSRDFTRYSLTQSLREIIACFPVYRTYVCAPIDAVSDSDRRYIELAVRQARRRNPQTDASIFDFIRDVLLLRFRDGISEEDRNLQRDFVMKFQQVTGPVTAKGVEDTAFYRYNRLVSVNEVGGDPERLGLPVEAFHKMNRERLERWPGSLGTTSTHDTKRSEDARARIHVLSEVVRDWRMAVTFWRRLNAPLKREVDGMPAPSDNDEYLLYQTLVGSWPLENPTGEALAAYRERIQQYMAKATREAKFNTSWINPNADYDKAVADFVAAVLDDRPANRFVRSLREFQARIVPHGLLNSLAQTVLKLASPGVPDIYQGAEVWDFSLVDPDNRRPVDFEARRAWLEELRRRVSAGDLAGLAAELAGRLGDPRTKLYVVHRCLAARRDDPDLFARGAYLPLEPTGARSANLIGFARHLGGAGEARPRGALVVVPRFTVRLARRPGALPIGHDVWGESFVPVPAALLGRRFVDRFTGLALEPESREGRTGFAAAALFARFPAALLVSEDHGA